MKVNLLGEGHAYILAEMLTDYGVLADNNSVNYDCYDVNLVVGLWYVPKPAPENTVVFCMGSDVWRDSLVCQQVDLVLVPMLDMLARIGIHDDVEVWRMPVNTKLFKPQEMIGFDKRDVLFYGTDLLVYELGKVLDEVNSNPDKTFTLLGGGLQNFVCGSPRNLLQIKKVPYHLMPQMYLRHKEFKCWLNHPGAGGPGVMNYEALLMGLRSWFNGKELYFQIPDDVKMEVAIPRLIKILQNLKSNQ